MDNKVKEIIITTPINTEESLLTIDKEYYLKYKAIYNDGQLEKLIYYKSDGELIYNLEELKTDTLIYLNANVPINQDWYIEGEYMYNEKSNIKLQVLKLDNQYYKEIAGNRIFRIQK